MAASEITKKQPVIFNTIKGFQTLSYILWNFLKLFMHIIFLSPLQSSFFSAEVKMFSDIC